MGGVLGVKAECVECLGRFEVRGVESEGEGVRDVERDLKGEEVFESLFEGCQKFVLWFGKYCGR